jgi:predicted O-linked N-acetylglucosamine transferase (SPINDLY family)
MGKTTRRERGANGAAPAASGAAALAPVTALVRAGRFVEAEAAARLRVVVAPRDTEALSLLARLCLQNGRTGDAVGFAERHVALSPDDPHALLLAGRALRAADRHAEAVERYRAAVALAPGWVEAWIGLGMALRPVDAVRAREALSHACALDSGNLQARLNLANVLADIGDLAQAEALLRDVVEAEPGSEEALLRLGALLPRCGRDHEAAACLRRALDVNPLSAEAAARLATLEAAAGRLEAAASLAAAAAQLAPRDPGCLALAGDALRVCGHLDEAIVAYRACLEVDPEHVFVLNNLANVLCSAGRLAEAESLARRALALAPGFADGAATLGRAIALGGRPAEAQQVLDAAAAQPGVSLAVMQATLMNLNAMATLDTDAIVARHREYMGRVAFPAPLTPEPDGFVAQPVTGRLRVGYLSPDFRNHSVAYFVEPLLRGHDPAAVEVHCYSLATHPDETTQRLRALVPNWVECAWLDDEALAARIRDDGIHVLVDLAGHTAGGRLGVMARRPAPVQCTWLGYPTVTGLSAIDWRITDRIVDPPEATWSGPERPLHVEPSYYCYVPPTDAPEPSGSSARSDGRAVFASFNTLAKITDATLRLWSAALSAESDAMLLIKAKGIGDPGTDARLLARLDSAGIARERVTLRGFEMSAERHLAAFDEVDVVLDATPYNGATTTCEALWMGVPVVTLLGTSHAGRMGASILRAAGFEEWVARDEADYVTIATALARAAATPGRRAWLRRRIAASPLTDHGRFAKAIESAYRRAWAGRNVPHMPGALPGDGS